VRFGQFDGLVGPVHPAIDGVDVGGDIAFEQTTAYRPVAPGNHVFTLKPATSADASAPASVTVNVPAGAGTTVLAVVVAGQLDARAFLDDLSAPAAGAVRVRLIDALPTPSALDVSGLGQGSTRLSFPAATGYLTVAAAAADIEIRATGSTTVVSSLPDWAPQPGTVSTLVVSGIPPNVEVIPLVDAAGSGPLGASLTTGHAHRSVLRTALLVLLTIAALTVIGVVLRAFEHRAKAEPWPEEQPSRLGLAPEPEPWDDAYDWPVLVDVNAERPTSTSGVTAAAHPLEASEPGEGSGPALELGQPDTPDRREPARPAGWRCEADAEVGGVVELEPPVRRIGPSVASRPPFAASARAGAEDEPDVVIDLRDGAEIVELDLGPDAGVLRVTAGTSGGGGLSAGGATGGGARHGSIGASGTSTEREPPAAARAAATPPVASTPVVSTTPPAAAATPPVVSTPVPRPRLATGSSVPRLPGDRVVSWVDDLGGGDAARELARIGELLASNARQGGPAYQRLVGARAGGPGLAAARQRGLGADAPNRVTTQGATGSLPSNVLDRCWSDLVETGQLLLTLPDLSAAARDQLLRVGAQAEAHVGQPVLIFVRLTPLPTGS